MRKKAIIFTGTITLLSAMTGTVLAAEPAQGEHVTSFSNVIVTKPSPDQKELSSLVTNETDKEASTLAQQLSLLQSALAPETAKEAAESWGKAISMRNGAFQYALFTQELKEKAEPYFKQEGWVTGGSSPWVETWEVTGEKKRGDATYEYTVTFALASSTGYFGKESATITVKNVKRNWYIDKVIFLNPNSVVSARTPYMMASSGSVDNVTYRAAEYAFSIPKSWDTKYRAVEKDGKLTFYYTPKNPAISERFLFSIEKVKEDVWEKDGYEEGLHRKITVKDGYVYAMLRAGENQYADRPHSVEYKEFEEMSLESKLILDTFLVKNR